MSKQKNYYFKKVIEKIKINKDKPPKKILEIGYGKGEFLIFAFDVLGHLEKIKLNELFLDVKTLLNKNESFIARFPNGDSSFSLPIKNGYTTHLTYIASGKMFYLAKKYKMHPT